MYIHTYIYKIHSVSIRRIEKSFWNDYTYILFERTTNEKSNCPVISITFLLTEIIRISPRGSSNVYFNVQFESFELVLPEIRSRRKLRPPSSPEMGPRNLTSREIPEMCPRHASQVGHSLRLIEL
jgi:hypothetical protein